MTRMIRRALILVVSILVSSVSFVLAWGMVQYYLTRNLPGDDPFGTPKLCLNFTAASFIGGAMYAIIRRIGTRWLAIIPPLSLGVVFAALGGIKAHSLIVPVLAGSGGSLLGAYLVHKIASTRPATLSLLR